MDEESEKKKKRGRISKMMEEIIEEFFSEHEQFDKEEKSAGLPHSGV